MTGLTPSGYKHLKLKRRTPLENVWNNLILNE
jgi:hypothetical protein